MYVYIGDRGDSRVLTGFFFFSLHSPIIHRWSNDKIAQTTSISFNDVFSSRNTRASYLDDIAMFFRSKADYEFRIIMLSPEFRKFFNFKY